MGAEADDAFGIGALAHDHEVAMVVEVMVSGVFLRSVRDGESKNLEGKVTSQDIGGIYRISFLFC